MTPALILLGLARPSLPWEQILSGGHSPRHLVPLSTAVRRLSISLLSSALRSVAFQ